MGKWYIDLETRDLRDWSAGESDWWYKAPEPTDNEIVDAVLLKYKRQDKNPFIATQSTWKPKWRR